MTTATENSLPVAVSTAEARRLAALEKTIEVGQKSFIEVGNALAEIRDSRLYRSKFQTFENYCQDKWGWTGTHARRLIEASNVVKTIPIGSILNEWQARELARVAPEKRIEVLELAGPKPTATSIREAAETFREPVEPVAPSDLPGPGTIVGDYLAKVEATIAANEKVLAKDAVYRASWRKEHQAALRVEALISQCWRIINTARGELRWKDFNDPLRKIGAQLRKLAKRAEESNEPHP